MSRSNGDQDERSPFLRPGFIAAAGFLFLVVVFAVIVVGNDKEATPKPSPPPPAAQPSPPPGQASPAGCRLPDKDQRIPQTGPPATWTLFQGVALPTSPAAGPAIVEGDVARCYARTPTGALFALQHIDTRNWLARDWRRVTDLQVMPGPGRDKWIRLRRKVSGGNPAPGRYGQTAGFKFVTYTRSTAVIEMATRFADGSLQSTVCTLMWSGDDWRLQLQPDGSDSPTTHRIPSLDGFVAWGGV